MTSLTLPQLADIVAVLHNAGDGLASRVDADRHGKIASAYLIAKRHYDQLAAVQHELPQDEFEKVAEGVAAATGVIIDRAERSDVSMGDVVRLRRELGQ